MKQLYLLLSSFCFFSAIVYGQSQMGELSGTVYDHSGNPVPYAHVVLLSSGRQISGAASDHEGRFSIKPISVGTYDVNVSAIGFASMHYTGQEVRAAQIHRLDIHLQAGIELIQVEIKEPLLKIDQTVRSVDWDRETVLRNPTGSIAGMLPISAGVISNDRGTSALGSRGPIQYYIDGVKTIGSPMVPLRSVKQIQVILGGVPADIGDATGGVVQIFTIGY